jgi:hypothetical protein
MKKTGIITFTLFAAFLVYANLEPAPLHTYAPPSAMTIFKCSGLERNEQATLISQYLEKADGVTAHSVNVSHQIISIAYNPEKNSSNALQEKLKTNFSIQPIIARYQPDDVPVAECPIPHGFFTQLEKVKYAFCFR